MTADDHAPRLATPDDAVEIAGLLHDFNLEFGWPSPSPDVLAPRLRALLGGPATFAYVAGTPIHALALVTLRPNVWVAGSVAVLDEMYVVPSLRDQGIGSAVIEAVLAHAREHDIDLIEINVDEADADTQRFYAQHGFSGIVEETGERAFYFAQEIERG
ncbi:GNAT family N-acetyltransferase [Mumia quercus]|uniref:GNAT family N-acetyltransferase n=1 Tax=Mumia quercus TaxID=2976125 RepID=UPI0021CF992A|nr:GNAT family N-acetyltransferase [Mumia quercus]